MEAAGPPAAIIPQNALLPRGADADARFEHQRVAAAPQAVVLRYYEPERDYQPGLRRGGTSSSGQAQQTDVPAVMTADLAQQRADQIYRLGRDALERMRLRVALFDPGLQPGRGVVVEDVPGHWRVRRWQWGGDGIDLDLVRQCTDSLAASGGNDPGRSVNTPDGPIGSTSLALFDLPSPLDRPLSHSHIAMAVAGASPNWRGAQVYQILDDGSPGELLDFVRVGAIMGRVITPPGRGTALLRDDLNSIVVQLVRDGPLALVNADEDALARGANLVAVGSELIQFALTEPLGERRFRLSGLWRGRGGTEDRIAGHVPDEAFALLGEALALVDPDRIGTGTAFRAAAQGRGDAELVGAGLAAHGRAVRPLSPVHGCVEQGADGGLIVRWLRRSRAGFAWRDLVDVPLAEDVEAYRLTLLADDIIVREFEAAEPRIELDTVTLADARGAATQTLSLSIAQRGALGVSPPLVVSLPL